MKFFTVGYGGRIPHELVELLAERGIRLVVDVRLRPDRASMGAYVKAKEPTKGIENLLAARGIAYQSFIELGNVFLDYDNWQEKYEHLMERAGELLTARVNGLPEPFCLLCAEKRVAECHRRKIADYLVRSRGWEVEHIE